MGLAFLTKRSLSLIIEDDPPIVVEAYDELQFLVAMHSWLRSTLFHL